MLTIKVSLIIFLVIVGILTVIGPDQIIWWINNFKKGGN